MYYKDLANRTAPLSDSENIEQKVSQDTAPSYSSGEGGEAREESVKLQPRGAFYPSGTLDQPPEQCLLGPPALRAKF